MIEYLAWSVRRCWLLLLSFGREPLRRLMAMQNEKVEVAGGVHAS